MKMMISALLFFALPTQAFALSCMRPSVEQSFKFANERSETFIIAHGSLKRTGPNDPPKIKRSKDRNVMPNGMPYRFQTAFKGKIAGRKGFGPTQSFPVTVQVTCSGPWCGGDSLSTQGLYFLRKDGAGSYTLEAHACGAYFFQNPSKQDLKSVIGCFKGGCG